MGFRLDYILNSIKRTIEYPINLMDDISQTVSNLGSPGPQFEFNPYDSNNPITYLNFLKSKSAFKKQDKNFHDFNDNTKLQYEINSETKELKPSQLLRQLNSELENKSLSFKKYF